MNVRAIPRRLRYRLAGSGDAPRLHLGCGRDYWDGWVNVDADPDSSADLVLDFQRIGDAFPAGSVREVALIHSLSYLPLWAARDLLRTLHRLLQPGGRLVLELPDVAKLARAVLDREGRTDEYLEAVRAFYAFGMDQVARREPYTPYAFGWSAWHLVEELRAAGFADVRILEPQTHDQRRWRDLRVEAVR